MSRKIKVNFTGVEVSTRCAEGEHIAKCIELEQTETGSGDDMIKAKFEVTKGSSAGAIVYDNFVLTEKGLFKLKAYMMAVGLKADGKIIVDLDKLLDKKVIINVVHKDFNGTLRANIDEYKKLELKKSEDDEDEDEEDEEVEEKPKKVDKKADKKPKKPEPEEDDDDDEEEEPPKKKSDKKKEDKKKPKKPSDDDEDEGDDWDEA